MGQITSSAALLGVMEHPVGGVCAPVSQLSMPLMGLLLLKVALPLALLHTRRVAGFGWSTLAHPWGHPVRRC